MLFYYCCCGMARMCLAFVFFIFICDVASYQCVPVPDVSCACEYNGQLMDLSLGDLQFPLKAKHADETNRYEFYYDPCRGLGVYDLDKDCKHSSVCQQDINDMSWYSVGGRGAFSGVPGIDLKLSHTSQFEENVYRSSIVSLDCQEEGFSSFTYDFEKKLSNVSVEFHFTLSADACCLRDKGTKLSAGSVLLIIFFVLLFVYLAGGMLCNKCIRGYSGLEVIPHFTFWAGLPSLVTDGWKFLVTCGCCKPAETAPSYDNI